MQAWTKSVLLNFMVEGRESADMILIHQSDHYHLHLQFLQGCKVFYNLTSTLFFFFFIFFCNNNSCIFAVILHSLCREFDGFPPRFSEKCFLSCQWTEIIIKELKICPPLPWQGSCSLFDRNCLSRKQMCWVLYYSEFDFHGKWLCIITTGNLNTYLTKFSWCFVHLLLESQSHKSCRTYLCDEIIMHFALMMTSHFRRGRGVFIVLLLQCRKLQC